MKPARVVRPFGAFGSAVGLIAAASFLPDGCTINEAASFRLRVGVPLWTPLAFCAIAYLIRKRPLKIVIPLLLLAEAIYCAGIGVLYDGVRGLAVTHIAAVTVAPILVTALIAMPLAVLWQRRSLEARSSSPPARADRAIVWSLVAAGANLGGGVFWLLHRAPLDRTLGGGGAFAMSLLCIVAAAMLWRVRRGAHALELLPSPSAAMRVPLEAPFPDAAQVIDWGLGDARVDQLDPAGAGPFRAGVATVWLGDRKESLRRVRQDLWLARIALVLALAGLGVGIAGARRAPPWNPPKDTNLSGLFVNGC